MMLGLLARSEDASGGMDSMVSLEQWKEFIALQQLTKDADSRTAGGQGSAHSLESLFSPAVDPTVNVSSGLDPSGQVKQKADMSANRKAYNDSRKKQRALDAETKKNKAQIKKIGAKFEKD